MKYIVEADEKGVLTLNLRDLFGTPPGTRFYVLRFDDTIILRPVELLPKWETLREEEKLESLRHTCDKASES